MLDKILLIMIATSLTLFALDSEQKSQVRAQRSLKLSFIVNSYMASKNAKRHVINLAGKQRMLTQKMVKLALLSDLQVDTENSKVQLLKTAKLYQQTLNGFLEADTSLKLQKTKAAEIRDYIKALQKEWRPFYENIKSCEKHPKALSYVIDKNQPLLAHSDKLVKLFKKYGSKSNFMEKSRENIIDIAGRERMLIEKMTKEKLLLAKQINIQENRKNLQQTITLFENSLKALRKGDSRLHITKAHDKEIVMQLNKVNTLWKKLKPYYVETKSSTTVLSALVSQARVLREEMNDAVHLCEIKADY